MYPTGEHSRIIILLMTVHVVYNITSILISIFSTVRWKIKEAVSMDCILIRMEMSQITGCF